MRAVLVGAAMAASICAGSAQAATTVLGNGLAHLCSVEAKAGSSEPAALEVCDMAIESESLTRRDLAGTYVNRGVIKMRRKAYRDARGDFAIAVKLADALSQRPQERLEISRPPLVVRLLLLRHGRYCLRPCVRTVSTARKDAMMVPRLRNSCWWLVASC